MRIKDYFTMLSAAFSLGLFSSIICYFIWQDKYSSIENSFWISWFGISVLSLPLAYMIAKSTSKCNQCGKAFALSKNGQTDIENFVKYKSENVTENGSTYTKNVPYNVRRYYQHMKCDNCGHESKSEEKTESKA
jgi:ribosomal protein S27E